MWRERECEQRRRTVKDRKATVPYFQAKENLRAFEGEMKDSVREGVGVFVPCKWRE